MLVSGGAHENIPPHMLRAVKIHVREPPREVLYGGRARPGGAHGKILSFVKTIERARQRPLTQALLFGKQSLVNKNDLEVPPRLIILHTVHTYCKEDNGYVKTSVQFNL